jgi:predicted nucleotidyltransferase
MPNGKLLAVEQNFEAKSPLGRLLVEHRERILAIAREHRATNVHVFGSVARGDDTPESDVDFLVEFLPPFSLLSRVGLIDDLESELGVSVDVSTPAGLKKRCRGAVLEESRVL